MAFKHIGEVAVETEDYIDKRRKGVIKSCKTGYKKLDRAMLGGIEYGSVISIGGRPSVGKCLGKGTGVMLFSGSVINVEDVKPGYLLMGPDSKPRTVLSTCKGIDQMYKIEQLRGITYRVNSEHILSLKRGKTEKLQEYGKVQNVSVKDYIKWEESKKQRWKGYMTECLNFPKKILKIDPYYLGLWLGDGSKDSTEITSIDIEISKFLKDFAKKEDLFFKENNNKNRCKSYSIVSRIGKGKTKDGNKLLTNLRKYNLLNNKHIPTDYIFNSKEVRLEFLAGIIDSDGHINKSSTIEITLKQKKIIEDLAHLCRTLGFRATVNPKKGSFKRKDGTKFIGDYFRLMISGDLSVIPLKIQRKKDKLRNNSRNSSMTRITVSKDIVDEYYGFVLDGDHLFLLEDGTVTHNTAYSSCILRGIIDNNDLSDMEILDFNWEMSGQSLIIRDLSAKARDNYGTIISAGIDDGKSVSDEKMEEYRKILKGYQSLPWYLEEEPKSTKEFGDIISRRVAASPKKKRIVRIDHSILAKQSASEASQVTMLQNLLMECVKLKKQSSIIFIILTQIGRDFEERQIDGSDGAYPRRADCFGGDAVAQSSETVILLNRPSSYGISYYGKRPNGREVKEDEIFAHVVKARNSEPDLVLKYGAHFDRMQMVEL